MKKKKTLLTLACCTVLGFTAFSISHTSVKAETTASDTKVEASTPQSTDSTTDRTEPSAKQEDTGHTDPTPPKKTTEQPSNPSDPGEQPAEKKGWITENEKKYYYRNGVPLTGKQKIGKFYYFFDLKTGEMKKGMRKIDGYYYLFGIYSGKMKIGRQKDNGFYYYFSNPDGKMQKGWITENGKQYYYADNNGRQLFGRKKINGYYYYLDKKTGEVKKGWISKKGKKYHYSLNSGKQLFGRKKISGYYYYLDKKTGEMKKGWISEKGKKYYYSDSNGRQYFGIRKIGSKLYKFDSKNGALIGKVTNSNSKIQSYTSKTSYLVLVNTTKARVYVYKGRQYNWVLKKIFTATTGKPSTPTKIGTFEVGIKGLYFNTGSRGRCWYFTQFSRNYLFHSVIYDRSRTPSRILDGQLGTHASHGCVRLQISNAKWIYDNIPRHTKVITFR